MLVQGSVLQLRDKSAQMLLSRKATMILFFMKAEKRGKGTKDEPTIVHALDNYRCVGCVCNEDDTNIKWMWIIEGKPKRCMCGYWFKLERHEPKTFEEFPV